MTDQPNEPRPVSVTISIDTSGFVRAMARASEAAHGFSVALMNQRRRRRHARRCHLCRPMANPLPLSVDGHAYRSRTRNRRGRR